MYRGVGNPRPPSQIRHGVLDGCVTKNERKQLRLLLRSEYRQSDGVDVLSTTWISNLKL